MLGLRFSVRPADVDETPLPGEAPDAYVLRLAAEKARALARPGELALGADTTVVIDGDILGKPEDFADACRMLGRIAGREHVVFTGVGLWDADRAVQASAVATSRVRMAAMGEEEIRWYAATGEPMDKAGAYAVQGVGAVFVEEVQGNYTNVVGLPLPLTRRLFAELGYDLRSWMITPRT
jgi:septum formation protein